MNIKLATASDIDDIEKLLFQVHKLHADKRPDLFKKGLKKYTREEITSIIKNSETPVYVYKEDGKVSGYAFLIYMRTDKSSMVNIKTMYVDDLCVDSNLKHRGIGTLIFRDLEQIAKDENCYNILLNVYNFNTTAFNFYKKCGMKELKTYMEKIIE